MLETLNKILIKVIEERLINATNKFFLKSGNLSAAESLHILEIS